MTATGYGYLRDSRIGDNLEAQKADCIALASSVGAEIVGWYTDHGVSAYDKGTDDIERPAYDEMCDALFADGAAVDYVFAFHNDRLWRDNYEKALFVRDAQRAGKPERVITNTITVDPNNPDDEFSLTMLTAMARKESADKQRRIKRQKQKRRDEGKATAPVVSFGWLGTRHGAERNDGTAYYGPEVARVREWAQRVLNGEPEIALAREANAEVARVGIEAAGPLGLRCPRQWNRGEGNGKGWAHSTIVRILTNPRNRGHMTHNGEIVRRDVFAIDGVPIIDAETAAELDAHYARRKRGPKSPHSGGWSGIVACGGHHDDGTPCAATMYHDGAKRDPRKATFGCRSLPGHAACGRMGVTAHHIVRLAHQWLVEYADGPELEQLVQAQAGTNTRALTDEANALHAELDEWFAMLRAHELSRAQYREACDGTNARLAKINAELAQLGARNALAEYVGRGDVLATLLADPELSPSVHRALFLATGMRVWVAPASRKGSGGRFEPTRVSVSPCHPSERDERTYVWVPDALT